MIKFVLFYCKMMLMKIVFYKGGIRNFWIGESKYSFRGEWFVYVKKKFRKCKNEKLYIINMV